MNNEVSLKFKNTVTGANELSTYAEQLKIIKSAISGLDVGVIESIKDSSSSLKSISKDVKDTSKKVSLAFNYGVVTKFARGLRSVVTGLSKVTSASSAFLEDFNLFQVSFEGNYQNAEKFVNKLSEMYGLDDRWLIKTTGIFKQLSNAMELSTESGEKLSQLMTQMSIDITSLYNLNPERASSILQSALAG